MKELEEVSCEIRRVVDFQLSVSDRLNSLENENAAVSEQEHEYNTFCGGFLNDATYAWLSYGSHLVVIKVRTGENASSWTFKERISSVCQFPAQPGTLPLLLIGLDNGALKVKDSVGWVCVFDCTTSRVLRAIRMPSGVEQVCVVSGGAEWEEFNEKRPDNILTEMGGIACAALRNLHHVMIDLQRPMWETSNSSVIMDEAFPADIEFMLPRDSISRTQSSKGKHAALNLLNSRIERHIGFNREEFESTAFLEESLTSVLISSTKIGCLISGCLGRIIIWQNDGSVGWISLPVDETMIVTHMALLEPMDDPRPFYYLWVVYQDETLKMPPLLRMYALLFERKYCDRGTNLYFNLEAEPSLKFEFELDTKDKVVSLSSIERGTNSDQTESGAKRGEDNLLLITTQDRTLLFDLNQWYKEQMPQTISECQNPNSILACYRTKRNSHNAKDNQTISSIYVPYTLREFPSNSPNSPEELFYPNSLSLEWIQLSSAKLIFWLSRGIQAELLRQMAIAGPIILTQPSETFHKCLSVGLVPFNSEFSFTSDQNAQRDMLLSLCLEQRWATFLVRCAKEWWDGSAAYLYPCFLKWGVQRASSIKMIADRLCVPLFDQSGSNIGEAEVKTLRFCSQQLECLSNVVAKLPIETSDLTKQCRALKRVSTYLQVLLWFYDVGLLPESQELEEGPLPISLALKIPYPFEKLFALYENKRRSISTGNENEDEPEGLFIDELIARECSVLNLQWEREAGETGGNGYYPPPSLQSLLRSYLIDCHQMELNEIESKHQITIYLLMDLAMMLQGSYPGVDQLIKYPSAFKMSPSLIKLTQAFWLLDHEDYQGFLDMMTGQLVSDSDVKDWHHKLVLRTLVRNNQHKLALTYLRIRKPPLSSLEDQSTLISLSVEHGLVQSAFHRRPQSHYTQLLLCFFQACKTHGKLSDILHLALDFDEEEVFVKFLEENHAEDLRLLYYLQRCRYTEANNGNLINQYSTKDAQATSFTMLNAYNATLPDVIKRFSLSMAKTSLDVDLKSRYPRPMSHYKSCNKTMSIHENVIKKAKETFLRGEKFQIPFISAPSVSLKLEDNHANMNCVLFPNLAQKDNGKRTVDEIYDEGESQTKTPDGVKRRKLVDDTDGSTSSSKKMTLNVAFNTPLVKRKVNVSASKETPTETPHSILKIRQLIRNSTSPSAGTSQIEPMGEVSPEKEKKINRQIRFSINQSKPEIPPEEVSEEEDTGKANMSVESEEAFFSPNISAKSYNESAVLSDSSIGGKNVYTPRPRPGLRRIYMQTPKGVNETPNVSTKTTCTATPSRATPATSNKRGASKLASTMKLDNSLLSTSIYTPPVLSRDSSFEMSIPSRFSDSRSLRKQASYNFTVASTPLIKNTSSKSDDVEDMDVDDEETQPDLSHAQKMPENHEGSTRKSSGSEQEEWNDSKKSESAYKNGDILKSKSLHKQFVENEDANIDVERVDVSEDEENDAAFESLSNISDENIEAQKKDRLSWSPSRTAENAQNTNIHQEGKLGNGENFDITDDESLDEMALIYEESRSETKRSSSTTPQETHRADLYDASNITEDESDSSMDMSKSDAAMFSSRNKLRSSTEKKKDTNVSKAQPELTKRSATKTGRRTKKSAEKTESAEHNVFSEGNNPSTLTTTKHSVSEAEFTTFNESILDSSALKDEGNVRVTRSRRASSIAKETIAALSSSPRSEKTRSARRASSLAKEVLTASILPSDDAKRVVSSGSEDSGTSSPRTIRTRRAASVAKDANATKENIMDESELKVRRSSRRAVSVEKEVPEATKQLTRANRISSTSSLISEDGDEEAEVESKGKRSSARRAGASTRSTRTTRTQVAKKEAGETEVKPTRRRGSSEPKEVIQEVRTTRRSSSVMKEVIPEVLKSSLEPVPEDSETTLESSKGKRKETRSRRSVSVSKEVTTEKFETSLDPITEGTSTGKETRSRRSNSVAKEVVPEKTEGTVESTRRRQSLSKEVPNSSAANTRSRRSSIQSIPEELEEILSVPSRERKATNLEKKSESAPSGHRQRRATSVDLPETTTQRNTRNTRRKSILKETIVEEEPTESEKVEALNTKKVPTRRKRTTSDASSQEAVLPRRGQKATVQEAKNQFSFSQPEDAGDPSPDQKVTGEVPNYVFSPPQTRSKNIPDQQRRQITFKPVEENQTGEEGEEQVQSSLQTWEPCTYRHVTVHSYDSRVRTKFVVPKRLKNTTD